MDYNNNASSKTLYSRKLYTLFIGPNDSCTSHSIFKLSTKKILITPKYKSVPMPEDLIVTINETTHLQTKFKSITLIVTIIQLKKIILTIFKMTIKITVMIWITLIMRVTMN